MGERDIGLAISVYVRKGATLGIEAVGDLLGLPHGAVRDGFGPWVAIPPKAIRDPTSGDEIGQAVVIDIDDPFAAIGDEFIVDANGAELMLLPLAAVGTWIFVPVSAAEQVRKAIAIHVKHRDAFGMVGAETMGKKGHSRFAVRVVTWMLHAELGGVRGILRMSRTPGREKQNEDGDETFG